MTEFDLTPEIRYRDGKAVKVVTYFNWNNTERGSSEYGLKEDGTFTEWHYDPEHGGAAEHPVERSRLEQLDAANPHTIPVLRVLGSDRGTVDTILAEKSKEARHVDLR